MKIHEYQAKELLEKAGIPVPRGKVAESPSQAADIASELGIRVVIKAQVHAGGRGKAGGIKLANTPREAEDLSADILQMTLKGLPVKKVLVEEAVSIQKEYYLGFVLDREQRTNTLMVSTMGGIDIEEVAANHPDKIAQIPVDPLLGLVDFQARQACFLAGIDSLSLNDTVKIIQKLFKVYQATDATLAEINPLVVTAEGRVMAADAKFNLDDNALYRHPELESWKEESEEDPIEAEAHRRGIQYVRLEGDIGIIGNGAGLVMATLDEVKRAGGNPANFLDIGGGAKAELVRNALEIVLMDPHVKGVLFNVFGGITRCDEVALGILKGMESLNIQCPIVVRLTGTREKEGRDLLKNTSLVSAEKMTDAAKLIWELTHVNSAE